ncbi:MAG: ribosome biogenesis GTPase Der [Candidatus Marinimicrobia bacterium]|nr:ribosome biogenesis GTPase Der [Candidatus Neomarinimicrobiota bacterium]|tara:strand:- start:1702 stop:3009 length:1308 start_codon:yes stop_codon:yes gene_type:complete
MKNSVIAIIGRPNVGKSTLFNRMVGKNYSIVSEIEGVTRDRVIQSFNWANKDYNIIDTGGFNDKSKDVMNQEINLQSVVAQQQSDLILLVMDIRKEITSNDRELSQMVLKSGKPYIFVLNKVDTNKVEFEKNKFYELGLSEPVLVSAQTGYNMVNLLEAIESSTIKTSDFKEKYDFSIAVIGMPNVGKSSFVNRILNKRQNIVTDIAGTTRDSINSYFKYYNKTIKLIDTAGLRKISKIKESIEYYSLVRTNRSVDYCDIALLIIDGDKGFDNQDRDIARMVIDKGKGMVVVFNKWDLIEKDTHTINEYKKNIINMYPAISNYPIIFTSVKTNKRVQDILRASLSIYKKSNTKINTNQLNLWLNKILTKNPPPSVKGKNLKVKFISQIRNKPPLFVLFANHPNLFPVSYKRYIENQLRLKFDLQGLSLKISFRKK